MQCDEEYGGAGCEAEIRQADGSGWVGCCGEGCGSVAEVYECQGFRGDSPTVYETLDGFPTKPVAFGSDAPQLKCFGRKMLCGPGSILVAHRPEEHILISDLTTAVANYVGIYTRLTGGY